MARASGQKLKLLYIADIFKRYSDEEHPLTADALIDKLAQNGISAERKSIYADIEDLKGIGMDIIYSGSKPRGYFLASRDFELPEIYLLADAVRSAKFITPKKTRELVSKLDSMLSVYQAAKREKNIYFDSRYKCDNETIFYTVDAISEAIEKRKKTELIYINRRLDENKEVVLKEKKHIVSPYAMAWQDDCYYLICNNEKYDNLMHLRIDRIKSVKILKKDIRPFSEVSPYTDSFDTADYTRKLFQMHSGKICDIDLRCDNSLLEPILDRFSDSIFIRNRREKTFDFTASLAVSEALVSWILSYGEKIRVLAPKELRDRVTDRAKKILEVYK